MTEIQATGVLDRYTVLSRANAEQSARFAAAVIRAARNGLIPVTAVAGYLKEIIGAAAVTAALLADLAMSADLSRKTGSYVPPLQLDLPEQYLGTIRLGVQTVTEDIDWNAVRQDQDEAESVVKRVERLARAVPLDAGEAVQTEALKGHGVELWTRGLDGQSCNLCKSLADGTVLPITRSMLRHPNCNCVRLSVLDPDVHAGDVLTEAPADVTEGPQRKLSTGHGLGRVEYTKYSPGLSFSRSAPRVKDLDRFSPTLNGATEAARRANRGRTKPQQPIAPVINLDDYRKKKNNGK